MNALSCATCNGPLGGTRIVVDGWWQCPDCAYKRERPNASTAKQGPFLAPIATTKERKDRR